MKLRAGLLLGLGVIALCMADRRDEVYASSAIAISGISGKLQHGASVTIAGAGFGTRPATPLKYDDFEAGAAGRVVGNGWEPLGVGGDNRAPVYSTRTVRPNSTRSVESRFIDGTWNSSFGITNSNLARVYVDAWYYLDAVPPYSRNHKILRFHADKYENPQLAYTMFCRDNSSIMTGGGVNNVKGETFVYLDIGPEYYSRKWSHVQLYIEQSSPGRSDGTLLFWVDGVQKIDARGSWRTRESGQSLWDTLWLGHYLGHGSDNACASYGDARTYWDNVYIDTTQARIEIGDAPSYSQSRHREIQIPTAWSDTGIRFTVNRGSFRDLNGLYLYVVDSAGNVSRGYPLSGAAAPDGTEGPAAPTGLRIVG